MSLSRRSLLAATAGLAGTAILAGCSTPATSPASGGSTLAPLNVTFGYIGDFNGTSLLAIANDQKLWQKYNINASTNGSSKVAPGSASST